MKNRPPGNYRCVSDFLLSLRISQNPFTLCISGLQGFLNRREDILLSFYKLQFILESHFMPCFYLFLIMHFFVRLQSGKRRIKMQSFRASSLLILFSCGCLVSLIIVRICQSWEFSSLKSPLSAFFIMVKVPQLTPSQSQITVLFSSVMILDFININVFHHVPSHSSESTFSLGIHFHLWLLN